MWNRDQKSFFSKGLPQSFTKQSCSIIPPLSFPESKIAELENISDKYYNWKQVKSETPITVKIPGVQKELSSNFSMTLL